MELTACTFVNEVLFAPVISGDRPSPVRTQVFCSGSLVGPGPFPVAPLAPEESTADDATEPLCGILVCSRIPVLRWLRSPS